VDRTFMLALRSPLTAPEEGRNYGLFGNIAASSPVFRVNSAGNFQFVIGNGTASQTHNIGVLPFDGNVHIVFVTWAWATKTIAVYLDGVQLGSVTYSQELLDGRSNWLIGRYGSQYWPGSLLPFAVFPKALGEETVKSLSQVARRKYSGCSASVAVDVSLSPKRRRLSGGEVAIPVRASAGSKRRRHSRAMITIHSHTSIQGIRRRWSRVATAISVDASFALHRRYTKPGSAVISDEPVGSAVISDEGSSG
jgi:hypothetical protein